MKKLLFLFLLLSSVIFTAEYNTDDIEIFVSGNKYYPVLDGIVLEGENVFIVGKEYNRVKKYWAYSTCDLSEYSYIKKVVVTYEKTKVTGKPACYDSKDEIMEKNKKK